MLVLQFVHAHYCDVHTATKMATPDDGDPKARFLPLYSISAYDCTGFTPVVMFILTFETLFVKMKSYAPLPNQSNEHLAVFS